MCVGNLLCTYTQCGNWVSLAEPHTVDSDVLIIGGRSASLGVMLLSENNFFLGWWGLCTVCVWLSRHCVMLVYTYYVFGLFVLNVIKLVRKGTRKARRFNILPDRLSVSGISH